MPAIRIALGCLLLSCAMAGAGVVRAAETRQAGEQLPFELQDLRRRAAALTRAAESLLTLLEGRNEGRLPDAEFKAYFTERSKLLKDLAKDIERDPSVLQIDRMKRQSGARKLEMPRKPKSLEEAAPLIELAAEDARQLKVQIESISEDYALPEVSVAELARPSPKEMCRRILKTAEYLADFAKDL